MVNWRLVYTKQALKDVDKIKKSPLQGKVKALLRIIAKDPFYPSPPYKKLVGDLTGVYARRINIQHRLLYQVYLEEKTVKIIRLWTHYE